MIFQDYVTYHLSARENIGVGRLDQLEDMGAVREAADRGGATALIEIGLVLFAITLMVNMASRILIWQMNRPVKAPRAARVPIGAATAGGTA